MMTAELIDSQLALNFLKCPGKIKTNFYRPTTIPVLQFYVKELLWNEKSREHFESEVQPSLVCRVFLASKKKSL